MLARLGFAIVFCFYAVASPAQYKVRFEILSLPSNHIAGSEIYIAGSFNSWNPANKNFKFQEQNGSYFIDLHLPAGNFEYKITRGGWDKVECTLKGEGVPNRVLKIEGEATIQLSIGGWQDNFAKQPIKHSASKNVQILDTAFFIPQLNRTRRVWIYLPPDYNSSKKKYPVLYMHDGQNVFDDATSYAGEWGVDECIDSMAKTCIVVAVDNGLNKRLNEYSPYDFSLTGIAINYESKEGEGDRYVEFLAKTLKPYIDKRYRTKKDRKNTSVAGSSMGGLISMYAVLKYPKIFGGAGVFSPAFWVGPKIFEDIKARGHKVKSKIYFYAGVPEAETMAPYTLRALEEMKKVSKSKMVAVIRAEGLHNEQRWRMEFPLFYRWMFL